MKPLATLINAIAFTALFVAYASVEQVERPDGVRRALETYARTLQTGAPPARDTDQLYRKRRSDLIASGAHPRRPGSADNRQAAS
ncbi:hypothetical protein [Ensifer sp. LCM 4579]|uniref:hypothetical protein n=1 Tax=Ensifer sp. LCM 4579 TaxID=1848292 RepID=UPI0008D8E343|nr:hypothetical protein [Ensifer sp. LCM 4579]OHV85549.1 hypothetical protein LCM4579_01830 [Ensifer sp. LCM 4579]